MVSDYTSRKNEVLDAYDAAKKLVSAFKNHAQNIGMPDPEERVLSLLGDIDSKAEKVRADRFCLMVAGESKSGKSTFINAYLGFELLPMDIKQCTSAIVEIKYGDRFHITATYADGRKKEVDGDENARDFLRKNASLDDEYRDIPVPTINSEILVKSGLRANEKNANINIIENEVEELLNAQEVREANIHNIPLLEYNKKIRDYIDKKKSGWRDIVVKIEVFFPFKGEAMRGIEIVDSPGTYARGGVSEITDNYIKNADAIIFLKPISGQALESTLFNKFIQNNSLNRNKNALFLVLTRATDLTPKDLKRMEDEAYKQFSNLNRNNILIVDSKAELYAKKFSGVSDIKTELLQLSDSGTLDHFVMATWFSTGKGGDDDNGSKFIKNLQNTSGFEQIYSALEKFGRSAHYLLLASLLNSICNIYLKLCDDINGNIEMFGQKAGDPAELAKKIAIVKQELDIINNKMYKGVDEIVRRFGGEDGIIKKNADNIVAEFKKNVDSIDNDSPDAFSELERYSKQTIVQYENLSETLQKEVVSECDKELVALSDKSGISFISLKPDFTETTFDKIREATESTAVDVKTYKTGVTFKKTHTHSEYSKNKHYNIVKGKIMTRLKDIENTLIDNLGNFVNNIRTQYIDELGKNAKSKKRELDTIIEMKATAEQIKKIIVELEQFKSDLSSAKLKTEEIKRGIEKCIERK